LAWAEETVWRKLFEELSILYLLSYFMYCC